MKKNKLFKLTLIAGVLIRIVLAVTTYHTDLAALSISSFLILKGHIFDLYQQGLNFVSDGLIYQPLAYFIPSLVYLPFRPLVLQTASGLFHTDPFALVGKSFYLPLLIYKLPLILADLGVILLLPQLFKKKANQKLSQIFWALNPLAIYASSMIGQIDAVLVFFLVAGTVAALKERPIFAAVLFALSALTKPLALLLIPLLAVYIWRQQSPKSALSVLAVGFLTFLIFIAPFLSSVAYKHYVLGAHHMLKVLQAGISIASGTVIPWFFILYSLFFLALLREKISLFMALGATVFSSLVFTHFHPQWFVWVTPWLIYLLIKKSSYLEQFFTLLAWLIILFSFEKSLHLDIFIGFQSSALSLPPLLSANLANLVLLARAWLVAVFIINFLPSLVSES